MARWRRQLVLAVIAALLPGAVPALAAGRQPVRIISQGVSILVPPPWANRTGLLARDPSLARQVEAGGPLPILYLTAPTVEFFNPNLILQRGPTPVPDVPTAQVLAVVRALLARTVPRGQYRMPAHLPTSVGGYPAVAEQLRGALTGIVAGQPLSVSVIGQVFMVDVRHRLYVVRFTAPASLWAGYQPAWVTMLRSLSFGR